MFDDLKFFAMAHRTMHWLTERQKMVAENIANANTPHYQPKDIKPLDFKTVLGTEAQPVRAVATNPMHISPVVDKGTFDTVTERRPEESKLDGNAVLLEEQTKIIGDIKDMHSLATTLLQANMALFKTALGTGNG
jgi:flagellar basal-body rod protein FlgB